jgi:hypothetical protein
MLPPKLKLPPAEQALLKVVRQLPESERQSVLSYAEFLLSRLAAVENPSAVPAPVEPLSIPRPESESVIAAIRRLSETYPMLDRDELLHETTELMTAHVMRGRPAQTIIDELEVVFRRRYERVESPSQ